MEKEKYPSGKCDDCGKIFERPCKFRTEREAYHVYGCRLKSIENALNNNEDLFDIYGFIDEVERISKISSFGAKFNPKNKYYERMVRCDKLIKKLKERK